jgi:hypothetical protein
MERHGFPVELAVAGLVLLGLLLVGSNSDKNGFRSAEPDYKMIDPQSVKEVKAQYKALLKAREARNLARDGAPETAVPAQPAKH